jgi:phosphate transport system substrate-binding protein
MAGAAAAEELLIPGSGNNEYLVARLAEAFNAAQDRHHVSVPSSTGTAGAIRALEEGTATLVRVGRPLKDAERSKGYVYISLGRDAIEFVGGADVSVLGISASQVMDIYSGKTTDWGELGGKPGLIRAIGREVTDASRSVIGQHIKGFGDMRFADGVKLVHLDPQAIALLDRFSTSFGFLNRSARHATKTGIVPLLLDSMSPTPDNVASGRYPLWLELGLAHKKGELTEAGKAFVAFVGASGGVQIMRELGIVVSVLRQ